jgi:hypothetical protein
MERIAAPGIVTVESNTDKIITDMVFDIVSLLQHQSRHWRMLKNIRQLQFAASVSLNRSHGRVATWAAASRPSARRGAKIFVAMDTLDITLRLGAATLLESCSGLSGKSPTRGEPI